MPDYSAEKVACCRNTILNTHSSKLLSFANCFWTPIDRSQRGGDDNNEARLFKICLFPDRLIAGGKLIKSDKDELEYNSSIVFIYPSLIMIEDGRFLKILDRKVQI